MLIPIFLVVPVAIPEQLADGQQGNAKNDQEKT